MFNPLKLFQKIDEVQIVNKAEVLTSQLIQALREKFPVEISECTDNGLDQYFPAPHETTTRCFPLQEASDKDLAWYSANEIWMSDFQTMGFRERMEFERLWFKRNNTHPDRKRTATMCSGSPIPPHKNVAMVYWKTKKLIIEWICPNSKGKYLRARRPIQS